MIFCYTQITVFDLTITGEVSFCNRWEKIQRPRSRQYEEREMKGGAELGTHSSKRNAPIKSLPAEFREHYVKGDIHSSGEIQDGRQQMNNAL